MSFARRRMNLMLLADGSVMAIGGTASGDDASKAVLAGEIWDPATEQWTTVESMGEARMYHSSSVLLPDGRVVVGGGEAAGRLRAQVYSPPYLFRGDSPDARTPRPATAAFGATFAVTSPDAASITSLALLRPSGVHARHRHEPALRAPRLHPVRLDAHGRGPVVGRHRAARRLHAHRQERDGRAVGGALDPDRARPPASSPAPIVRDGRRRPSAPPRSSARRSRPRPVRRRPPTARAATRSPASRPVRSCVTFSAAGYATGSATATVVAASRPWSTTA